MRFTLFGTCSAALTLYEEEYGANEILNRTPYFLHCSSHHQRLFAILNTFIAILLLFGRSSACRRFASECDLSADSVILLI